MTFAKGILAALALAAAVGQASATELEHWPAPAARQLNALIEANANKAPMPCSTWTTPAIATTWKNRCCPIWK